LATTKSTPCSPARIMLLMALPPAPPTPKTATASDRSTPPRRGSSHDGRSCYGDRAVAGVAHVRSGVSQCRGLREKAHVYWVSSRIGKGKRMFAVAAASIASSAPTAPEPGSGAPVEKQATPDASHLLDAEAKDTTEVQTSSHKSTCRPGAGTTGTRASNATCFATALRVRRYPASARLRAPHPALRSA
jgi:hypothetical protein